MCCITPTSLTSPTAMAEKEKAPRLDVSRIRLDHSHIQEFHLVNPVQFKAKDELTLNLGKQILLHRQDEEDRVAVSVNLEITPKEVIKGQLPLPLCKCSLLFGFTFPDLPNFIVKDENQQEGLDPNLHLTLVSLAFSTARGMLIQLTQGTFFDRAILPVFAPIDLVMPSQTSQTEAPADT